MENHYLTLGLELNLAVSETELQAAFQEAGKSVHPDAGGSEDQFARLRHAYATLASPGRRLVHWLELQGIAPDTRGTVDSSLMDLFGRVGEIGNRAESLARRRAEARSALARALTEGETQQVMASIESAIREVDTAIARETSRFPAIQQAADDQELPAGLPQSARTLAFLEKWRASLRALLPKLL